jgi:hypothetical protein
MNLIFAALKDYLAVNNQCGFSLEFRMLGQGRGSKSHFAKDNFQWSGQYYSVTFHLYVKYLNLLVLSFSFCS